MSELSKIPFTDNIRKASGSETVCYCSKVTKMDILRAISEGACSLSKIKVSTGACTQGRCQETSPRGR